MKIVHISYYKSVKKTKKEKLEELAKYPNVSFIVSDYKEIETNEPTYMVEMSAKELQLISFYLELENRKPIMNVEIDTKIGKEKENKDE